jgi:hypothetical protein
MADTQTEKPPAQETPVGESVLRSNESGSTVAPQDETNAVYPKGLTLALIIASLCLSVFLVNRAEARLNAPDRTAN